MAQVFTVKHIVFVHSGIVLRITAHILAWRGDLARRALGGATIPASSPPCRAACVARSFRDQCAEHDADIAKVQQWLCHANIATTRVYDRFQMRAEDRPTFSIEY
jgi:hypothetical protein